MTFRPAIALLLGALLASAGGCRTHRPVFGPQGTVYHQRLDAAVFDPFVDNQAGPEVVGGRPRTFQQPWSEAQRSLILPFIRRQRSASPSCLLKLQTYCNH